MKRSRKSKKRVSKSTEIFQEQNDLWEKEEDQREQKWVTHYCSDHQILLVGDGDFSFSLSLAKGFGSASNIVASSFDTYDEVTKKYKNAKSNLEELQKLGAGLLHGVDATAMKFYPDFKMRRFDRIIFNFPHAGFHGKEDSLKMMKMHMNLVLSFFKNASHMLRADGEIHVNHKTTPPFDQWNLEKLAKQSFMTMIACVDFNKEDYPGYNNKRGDGHRCDDPFPLGKCSTFKFINNPMEVSVQQMANLPFQEIHNIERFPAPADLNYHPRTILPVREIPNMEQVPNPVGYHPQTRVPLREIRNMEKFPAPNNLNYHLQTSAFPKTNQLAYYPQTSHFPKMNESNRSEFDFKNGYNTISKEYINSGTEIHGRVSSSADCYHYADDMTHETRRLVQPIEPLQSLQPRPTPTNCRYSLTDPNRRTMDIAPSVSIGPRNERSQDQPVEGRTLQEELYRMVLMWYNGYSLTDPNRRTMDIAPSISNGLRNERGQNQPVEGRTLQEELYRMVLMWYNRYSLTDPNRRTMNIAPSISNGPRNERGQNQPVEGRTLQEELYRMVLMWYNGYSLTDPNRRTMDIAPSISNGLRNERGQYQPVEGRTL